MEKANLNKTDESAGSLFLDTRKAICFVLFLFFTRTHFLCMLKPPGWLHPYASLLLTESNCQMYFIYTHGVYKF